MGKVVSRLSPGRRAGGGGGGDTVPIAGEEGRMESERESEERGQAEGSSHLPYVEFVGRDVKCPSCQGTGRIPREQENELVALIPYSDQRLQTWRTKLYVLIAVIVSLLLSGLAIFFLFPRSIRVEHEGLKSSYVSYDQSDHTVHLQITNILNVTNHNFYTISITDLYVQIVFFTEVIGTINVKDTTAIRALGGGQIFYTVKGLLQENGIYHYCTIPEIKVHNIVISIQVTVTAWYLSHSEQVSINSYQYVDCGSNTTSQHSPHHH